MSKHGHRKHGLWLAFALHRFSGVALALFLPIHFYVLSLALNEPERLDGSSAAVLRVRCKGMR